jgi:hypothetical protein
MRCRHDEGNTELGLLIQYLRLCEVLNVKEVWKPVVGYEGLYEVSNYGNVRSLERTVVDKNGAIRPVHSKLLTWHKSKITKRHPIARYHVELWKDNKRKAVKVHRLVAQAFIPNSDGKPQINHKDGDPSNNAVTNLEWVTSSENNKHAHQNKLIIPVGLKAIKGINNITGEVVLFDSAGEAARYFNVTPGAIRSALKGYGRSKGACGYKWEYQ